MINKSKSGKYETQLSSPSDLKKRIDRVLRLGKIAGADETEIQIDETIDALTRFANNAIHQNVAEHGITVSIRTVVDGRTARATTMNGSTRLPGHGCWPRMGSGCVSGWRATGFLRRRSRSICR